MQRTNEHHFENALMASEWHHSSPLLVSLIEGDTESVLECHTIEDEFFVIERRQNNAHASPMDVLASLTGDEQSTSTTLYWHSARREDAQRWVGQRIAHSFQLSMPGASA